MQGRPTLEAETMPCFPLEVTEEAGISGPKQDGADLGQQPAESGSVPS